MLRTMSDSDLKAMAPNCIFVPQSFVVEDDLQHVSQAILTKLERAGRTCYKSENRITHVSAVPFLRNIIKQGHESVIEHQSITVRLTTSRGVLAEITRHRLASFSVESTRYCDYSNTGKITFIAPDSGYATIVNNLELLKLYILGCQYSAETYLSLRNRGAAPQEARDVLNHALKTEIVITANLREWRHILNVRTAQGAHPQIRSLLKPVLNYFQELLPCIFEDIQNQ